jgi:hypothetical protein
MRASVCDAASSRRIFTAIELLAWYPMMVGLSLPPPNCGCSVTFVVLMSLLSMPEPTRASITAC